MALKLKQYTTEYKGLDGDWYIDRPADIITIMSNRDTGKTTNILGAILKRRSGFLLLTRYKNEMKAMQDKLLSACEYYDRQVTWSRTADAYVDENEKEVGFIASLSGAQCAKQQAERYHEVEYIVFDEFLPTDRKYLRENVEPGYELKMLKWIIGSVRKGRNGVRNRPIKIILLANLVDSLNPYLSGIFDEEGTSLLTHVARAVGTGQTNLTFEDSSVFLTVHIQKGFDAQDSLSRFVNGDSANAMADGFLQDFTDRIRPRNKAIEAQLTKPILYTGKAAMYQIMLRTVLNISGTPINIERPVFYWVPSNKKPSTLEALNAIDFDEYQQWYSGIVVKAEVLDFMVRVKQHSRTGF